VVVPLLENSLSLFYVLDLGFALAEEVKKQGGKARCFRTATSVIVEQTGISIDQVESLIDSFAEAVSKKGATLNVIIEQRDAPEIDLEGNAVIPGEFTMRRLTKKFLFGLPDGAIVVGRGEPISAIRLDSGKDRARVWRQAVNSGAAQRICSVYWNPQDVLEVHGIDLDNPVDDDAGDSGLPTSRMWD